MQEQRGKLPAGERLACLRRLPDVPAQLVPILSSNAALTSD